MMILPGHDSQRVSRRELKLLSAYAQLVEQLGPEVIGHGADAALLPTDKATLRDIIARVANQPAMVRTLQADDLPKLYGMLELFLKPGELEAVRAAESLAEMRGDRAPLNESGQKILDEGLAVLERAVHAFHESRDGR